MVCSEMIIDLSPHSTPSMGDTQTSDPGILLRSKCPCTYPLLGEVSYELIHENLNTNGGSYVLLYKLERGDAAETMYLLSKPSISQHYIYSCHQAMPVKHPSRSRHHRVPGLASRGHFRQPERGLRGLQTGPVLSTATDSTSHM